MAVLVVLRVAGQMAGFLVVVAGAASVCDDLIGGAWFALIALFIGVPPGHFIGLMVAIRIVENLSHVNARLSFGWLGERLLVSPRYHRWHHAVELPEGQQYRYGCNFAILFPIWDRLFGTQYHGAGLPPTGVHSPALASPAHADHFWIQQKDGLVGLARALRATLWPERR